MNVFVNDFLIPALGTALTAIITAIIGYIGVKIKKILENKEIDDTKKKIAKTVVEAVEQIYTDIHGEEKFYKAVSAMTEMLAERGITVSDLEIRMLIESAVRQLNVTMGTINSLPDCQECEITYTEDVTNA